MSRQPPDIVQVDLAVSGDLVDADGSHVPVRYLRDYLARRVVVPDDCTDIFVYVHGWRNSGRRADRTIRTMRRLLTSSRCTPRHRYESLDGWSPFFVSIRWPSMSSPFPRGYRRIRDRAHAMATSGRAPEVLAYLLGYLDAERRSPGPPVLRSAGGQYLHGVGHSFGCRLLGEATALAVLDEPRVLGRQRRVGRGWAMDTVVMLQMAAPTDIFENRFRPLVDDAPLEGPIVATWSTADRAAGYWHRQAEGAVAVGFTGARHVAGTTAEVTMKGCTEPYARSDFDAAVVNVDASRFFTHSRWRPAGAHSDVWNDGTAHLLLSLADLAR